MPKGSSSNSWYWWYSYLALLLYRWPIFLRCLLVFSAICFDFLGLSLVGLTHPLTYFNICVAVIAWASTYSWLIIDVWSPYVYVRIMWSLYCICFFFAFLRWRLGELFMGSLRSRFERLTRLWICGYWFIASHFVLNFFSYGWL